MVVFNTISSLRLSKPSFVMRGFLSVFLGLLTLQSVSMLLAQSLLIRGGTLIDGTGRLPIKDVRILIEGNVIMDIRSLEPGVGEVASDLEIIDAGGKFILPGFIDSHVHYRDSSGELFLAHGVTTVYDLGNPFYWQVALKRGLNQGKLRGPRFYFCGGVPVPGSPGAEAGDRVPSIYSRSVVRINAPNEARQAVRRLKENGVGCIKLNENFGQRMFTAIARESHALGLSVISHSLNALDSADWGINGIEHMVGVAIATVSKPVGHKAVEAMTIEAGHKNSGLYQWMELSNFDKVVDYLVRRQVFLNPTLAFEWKALTPRSQQHELEDTRLLSIPELQYVPIDDRLVIFGQYHWADGRSSNELQQFRDGYRKVQEFLRKFVEAGGKIYAGTDSSAATTPGLSLHHEMELLVDAGLSPMQAIMTTTKNAAELLGLDGEIGTVEPKKLADLVIVNADPLQDIRNTKQIDQVIQNGEIVDTQYHADHSNPIRRPGPESKHLYNPVPRLLDISPPVVGEGDSINLTVIGRGFVPNSVVRFEGNPLATKWRSSSELVAVLSSRFTSRVGTFLVSVETPRPGGGVSEPIEFIVTFK